ncbi:hypothetical protein NQ318_013620 [Aromia moschata]|uniref:Uncharacterized protein n=1 Tax=Aromia moschata TaxID=1265417 RepID=A0AAV8YMQ2_9CUCU|nr:hypothetical protein NQ318_013620 [Aromia moschata]
MSLLIFSVLLTTFSVQCWSPNNRIDDQLVEVFGGNSGVQMERITNSVAGFSKDREVAKKFLANYNSIKPVDVLIDDVESSYEDANNFVRAVFEITPNAKNILFTFYKFNSTGTYALIHTKVNNLFRKVGDEDLASQSGVLRKKNIRVYVVWGGLYSTNLSQEHLLMEVCAYSGGLFLVGAREKISSDYYKLFLEYERNLNVSIMLSQNNLLGPSEFTFPIDSKIASIHIRISPFVESGSLSAPNGKIKLPTRQTKLTFDFPAGYVIDILESDEVANYSTGSFAVSEPGVLEVHLSVAPRDVGAWRLRLNNNGAAYNVTVFVYTKLTVNARFVRKNASSKDMGGHNSNIVKLGISDYVTLISNISLLDPDGQALSHSAKYSLIGHNNDNASTKDKEKIISPEETITVRVTLTTKYGTYQDVIDFTASLGSETFTKKATVDVGTQLGYDNTEPELDYTFSSDCTKVIFSKCEEGTWTGYLQVSTVPTGIYFPNGYTTGTKEQVEGYYSDSCCNPDLQMIAVDRLNNRAIRNVNAYLAFWGPAQIAALVLGILLLILIIALIIYLIVRCVKKAKTMICRPIEEDVYDN